MSFLSTVRTNIGGGNKAEELEGQPAEGAGNSLKPREFFWDNIVLFVVSTILGLAAIDVITQFLRGGVSGGGIACFPPSGADVAQAAYINNYCSSFLPFGTYVTTFMVVHAILLIVPHYLWLGHYGGNFEFFFQLVSTLKRVQDHTQAGERIPENRTIVQQLESTFTLLNRNYIYRSYVLKLVLQLLWTFVGISFGIGFFVTRFNERFTCPSNFNSTTYEFWPLNEPVNCTYETLSLLQYLWIGDLLLLLLASFSLTGAILWSFSTHPTALGYKEFASFAFQSGFHPQYYVKYITSYPSCSSPHVIKTDLDFLVLRLYQTDGGLGHVLVEELVQKWLKRHLDDDHRRLALHMGKQMILEASDDLYKVLDKDQRHDLKWKFPKVEGILGVYDDFSRLVPDSENTANAMPILLQVPKTMCGAVLGFAALAPNNDNAINISFGDSGYTTALARIFKMVAHLNFSPYYNSTEAAKVTNYFTNIVSIECAEDVLSSSIDIHTQFEDKLRDIWIANEEEYDTGYIVVGPIPKDKEFHRTNLHLLLGSISGCLAKDAVLVCICPIKIGGKPVNFLDFEPLELRFKPYPVSIEEAKEEINWKSVPLSVAEIHRQLSLEANSTRLSDTSPNTQSLSTSVHTDNLHNHSLKVTCGSLECEVKFSLYKYKDNPHVRRLKQWSKDSDRPRAQEESDDEESSVIQVSGKMKVKDLTKKE